VELSLPLLSVKEFANNIRGNETEITGGSEKSLGKFGGRAAAVTATTKKHDVGGGSLQLDLYESKLIVSIVRYMIH